MKAYITSLLLLGTLLLPQSVNALPPPALDITKFKYNFNFSDDIYFDVDASTFLKPDDVSNLLRENNVSLAKIPDMRNQLDSLGESAVIAMLNEEDLKPEVGRLHRRGIFSDAWDWVKTNDATCTVAAATALPWYLKYAGIFKELHSVAWPQGKPSRDQEFFIFPLHGSISRHVTIFYESRRPPGFKPTYGSAFGKNIYIRYANEPNGADGGFTRLTKLLLHELTHSAQYKARDWSLVRFGKDYLFKFCKAGWSYSNNPMEREAVNKALLLAPLLDDTQHGKPFFKLWRTNSMVSSSLGFPTEVSYTNITTSPLLRELKFQKGVLQLNTGNCFRIFTGTEIQARTAADCEMRRCHRPRSPPSGWQGPPSCDHAAISAHNSRCVRSREKWKAIMNGKVFTC